MASDAVSSICPVLGVRDVRAAVRHLVDTLGFEEVAVFEPPGDGEAVYAIIRRGAAEIHLQIRRRELRGGARESIECDAYVRVEDADALHADVVGRGAVVHFELCDQDYGMRDFTVEGPEGHRIAFGAPLPG